MLVFELSGPNLVSIPNFSSISSQMADLSLFGAKLYEVPFVIFFAMATAQNVTNWFDLQKVSLKFIFKVRKFQLDVLSRFRMVEVKQEGGVFYLSPPPPQVR